MDAHAACIWGAWQGDSFDGNLGFRLQTSCISKSWYSCSMCQAETDKHIIPGCTTVTRMIQKWSSVLKEITTGMFHSSLVREARCSQLIRVKTEGEKGNKWQMNMSDIHH